MQLIDGGFRGRCFFAEGPLAGLRSEPGEDGESICSPTEGGRICPNVDGYKTVCSVFKDGFVGSIDVRRLHFGPIPLSDFNGNPQGFQGYISFDNIG